MTSKPDMLRREIKVLENLKKKLEEVIEKRQAELDKIAFKFGRPRKK